METLAILLTLSMITIRFIAHLLLSNQPRFSKKWWSDMLMFIPMEV